MQPLGSWQVGALLAAAVAGSVAAAAVYVSTVAYREPRLTGAFCPSGPQETLCLQAYQRSYDERTTWRAVTQLGSLALGFSLVAVAASIRTRIAWLALGCGGGGLFLIAWGLREMWNAFAMST